MNTAFIDYVDRLFEQAAPGKSMDALKEEMIVNLNEKYNDYRAEGLSQESAYEAAISGLGDVKALIRELGSTKKRSAADAPFAASLRWASQLALIAGAALCLLFSLGNMLAFGICMFIGFSGIATVNIIRGFAPYDSERRDLLASGVGLFFVAVEFFGAFAFAWQSGLLRFMALLIAFASIAVGVGLIIYGFAPLGRKKRMALAVSVPIYILAAGLLASIWFLDSSVFRMGVLAGGFASLAMFFIFANRRTKISYKKESKMSERKDDTIDYRGNGPQTEGEKESPIYKPEPEVLERKHKGEGGFKPNPYYTSAFWCFVVIAYFFISFTTDSWAYSWVIYVAAAGIQNLYFGYMRDRK
jgi:hypothetical protein